MNRAIYKPEGRAKEYSDLAVNLYNGCEHGCLYCYARKLTNKSYEEFKKAVPRKNILFLLSKEAKYYSNKSVLLCFMCDPYQPSELKYCITRQAIQILHSYNVKVNILTKGGARSIRDFDLLRDGDKYGVTLTFISEEDSKKYEPEAALPEERLYALKEAHKRGIFTWVSLEPVIDKVQTLELIDISKDYVDEFKVGKLNHDRKAELINWREFGFAVIKKLEKYNKRYYIKKDLLDKLK